MLSTTPNWKLVIEAINALNGAASIAEIEAYFRGHFPPEKRANNVRPDATAITVNANSRIHYGPGKQVRRTDSGNQYDQLFRRMDGCYELYHAEKHGIWEIARNTQGNLYVQQVSDSRMPDGIVEERSYENESYCIDTEYQSASSQFALESHLRDYLAQNLKHIQGLPAQLELFNDESGIPGIEYRTGVGFIDMAVSSPKCNELMMMLKEVEGLWHKQFGRALPVKAFARPGVELPSDGIELGLSESREVGALGEILPEQAISVLIDAPLPRAVRIGEVDIDASELGESFVLSHFASLIVSQGKTALRVDAVEHGSEASDRRLGGRVVHSCQSHEQRGSLNQRTDGRRVASALDQIAFPVTGDNAFFDFRRAHVDADHVRNSAPTIFAPCARPTALVCLTQTGDQFGAQFAARHGVQGGVDGLVTDLEARVVRMHSAEYACDLFRRMAPPQQALDMTPQRTILGQSRRASRRSGQRISALLCKWRAIATSNRGPASLSWRCGRIAPAVTLQLTTDRTRRTLHAAGNCPQRAAPLKTQLDHSAFFTTQVFAVRSHRNTLPPGKCCTSYLRPTILARDTDGAFYVLELKVSRGSDAVIGQVLRYIGWIRANLSKGHPVYGVVVTNGASERLKYAASEVPGIFLMEYELNFSLRISEKLAGK